MRDDDRKLTGDAEVLRIARRRFERAITAESQNRTAALDDLRFKAGDQWDPMARARREANKQPCLTINKMPTFVHQITNDQRQNRPAINVSPLSGGDKRTAGILKGLIRHIERYSNAEIAYDTGFDNAVTNGFGYWRVVTKYEDEGSFDQCICIERVRNPFTVYLDCDRQYPEGSDSEWAFVTELMPRSEFKEQWPRKDAMDWDFGSIGEDYRQWCDQNFVRIAEYFTVEKDYRKLVALANGHVGFKDELDESVKERIAQDPDYVIREREAECRKIMWYKITGKDVLEKQEWPGKWIPIVECLGDEVDVEGRVVKFGIIRMAKDPQRMKNYWGTSLTERVALETKSPWVMAEGQEEGHEDEWRTANTEPRNFITYKPLDISGKLVPPPMRPGWMGPPAGVMAAESQAEQDMMATTGVRFDATRHERSSDESGIALQNLRQTQQLGSYHYIDNLGRSLKHTGRIILDLVPHIYDQKRILTILNENGSDEHVTIDPQMNDAYKSEGIGQKSFNPKVGKYEVAVTVGPSFATKMREASASMIEFMRTIPNTAPYVADLVAKNQEWPESDQIAKRLAMLLPPGMNQPDDADMTPEVQALIGSMQQQLQQLTTERQQMMGALEEKKTDQAIQMEKINKDFEAKMAGIAATFEQKMQAISAQKDENLITHIRELVTTMVEAETSKREKSKKD